MKSIFVEVIFLTFDARVEKLTHVCFIEIAPEIILYYLPYTKSAGRNGSVHERQRILHIDRCVDFATV